MGRKQLASSKATGGEGTIFELRVQALFVALMLPEDTPLAYLVLLFKKLDYKVK